MSDLTQLFPITQDSLDSPSVDARKLHEWLGVGRDFSNWMKHRIDRYSFIEGQDFSPILATNSGRGRPTIDYLLSTDMAKELSMVENNDKGREVRQYFLTCEKELRTPQATSVPALPSQVGKQIVLDMLEVANHFHVPPSHAMQVAAAEATRQTGIPWDRLLTQAEVMQNVPAEDVMLEPTELGALFGMTPRKMNVKLEQLGLQSYVSGRWLATEEGQKISVRHAWTSHGKSGYNLKWKVASLEPLVGPIE